MYGVGLPISGLEKRRLGKARSFHNEVRRLDDYLE